MKIWRLISIITSFGVLILPLVEVWRLRIFQISLINQNFATVFGVGMAILLLLTVIIIIIANKFRFWSLPCLLAVLLLSWHFKEALLEVAAGTQGMPRRYYDYQPLPK